MAVSKEETVKAHLWITLCLIVTSVGCSTATQGAKTTEPPVVEVVQVERQDVPLSNAWLCMHSGSSSLTFVLYLPEGAAETALANGSIERMGLPRSRLRIRTAATAPALDEPGDVPNRALPVHEARAALDVKTPIT